MTRLRSQMSDSYDSTEPDQVQAQLTVSAALTRQLGRLMMTLEDYPALKSDQTMPQALQTYNKVEAQIAAPQRFYNAAVAEFNNAIQIFPGNLLADYAKAKPMPFFEGNEAAMYSGNVVELFEYFRQFSRFYGGKAALAAKPKFKAYRERFDYEKGFADF
ncbi:MAG: LemA family protein [Pseudomonadota bacterium]|nr:LemA family protein [Pseudomonadota bacterium]MEC8289384.1 LemA family protein [Pseudomonadota bacterium]